MAFDAKTDSRATSVETTDVLVFGDVSADGWDTITVANFIASAVTGYQPLDSDLTAIAALTTAAYGRSLLTLANSTALAAEVDSFFLTPTEGNAAYQPLDSDLTAIAALTTQAFGRSLLTQATAQATRTTILPSQASAANRPLVSNGTDTAWSTTFAIVSGGIELDIQTDEQIGLLVRASDSFIANFITLNSDGNTLFSVSSNGSLSCTNFTGSSSGTNTGDQNLFSTIAISGQSNVVADSPTDTLTLVAGTNITLTTNASTDTITITATGGSPAGSTGEVQYNNAGSFGGASGLAVNTSGNGYIAIRQIGGAAGTDEVRIAHDGTIGVVQSMDGGLYLRPSNGVGMRVITNGSGVEIQGDSGSFFLGSNANSLVLGNTSGCTAQLTGSLRIGSASQLAACSTTDATASGSDVGFLRLSAGVWKITDGSSGDGWIQNSAGVARVTANVTNITTTLANLTDLTATLKAGRKYVGTIRLLINNALAADGFKFDLNGGTATFTNINFGFVNALGATIGTRSSAAAGTPITLTALADTSDVWVDIAVSIVCNAAGTLIPRQAKNSDAAGATLTTKLGGYIDLEDSRT